jgi:dipeptidyl aminopeptidase/acylaminoacyl peptidase
MNSNGETYLTIEELISMPTLSGVTISEDGKNAAFVKKTADWKDNTYKNHIWIYEKSKEKLTTKIEGTSPAWSPESSYIAYLSAAGNGDEMKNQLFVESLNGRGRIQLTHEINGVSKFKWAPNGNGFYYTAQPKESEEIKKRKNKYGDFHHVGKEHQNHCLYFIEYNRETDADKDKTEQEGSGQKQLTDGKDFHIQEFDSSLDGKKMGFIATPSPDADDDQHRDLYILDLNSEELQKLNRNKLLGGSVCFSPDGSKIGYTASIREKEYYETRIQDSTIEIYDLKSGEFSQPLRDFDSTVTPIRWTARGIFMKWQRKTNYLMGLLSQNGTVEKVSEDGFVLEAATTKDGHHTAYIKAARNETFEVYLDDEKITNENRIIEAKRTSNREVISWKSRNDFEIEGVLTTPTDFDCHKTYPLLVLVHGGPAWASFPIHSGCFNEKYPVEAFTEKGFIVLEPNYRGSSGYGNAFLKANYRNLGIGDYEDVISGVDSLVEWGMADRERVGVMGWSQGGFISAFCSTYSDRFKAASVGGGMTNWRHHYVHTDLPSFIRRHLGNSPWNDPEIYSKASPMTYIKSACTPTLLQQGESDRRVPAANAYELFQGLRDMEVDTELIIFKGMAYSSDQPGMNAAVMKQNLIWFSHYLLGESRQELRSL